jgi:hypothetical protein
VDGISMACRGGRESKGSGMSTSSRSSSCCVLPSDGDVALDTPGDNDVASDIPC